jgi:D-glycero-D-manno-heptose 1,7-bisphosphate phosphatase
VLVGGLGTRLGTLVADTPKSLLQIGDRPFLAWLLREVSRFGVEEVVLLTGHLSDRIERALDGLATLLPRPMRIRISREPAPAGTGGALYQARSLLDERFLMCNGDSLLDFNFAAFLADAVADETDVVGRMVVRSVPDASRYGVVELAGDRVVAFRERQAGPAPDLINAGIYLLNRRVLDAVTPICSLERDVLPRLVARGLLRATRAEGYFIDIGIPADLARARQELPQRLRRPALLLGRGGTITVDHDRIGTDDHFEWVRGAREAIGCATARGWHVFVVINQAGTVLDLYDEEALAILHRRMADEVRAAGGTIDDIRYCPCRPEAPRTILDLLRCWDLNPAHCVLVGDQPSDIAAAKAAGIVGKLFPGGDLAAFVIPLLAETPEQGEGGVA